MYLVAVLFLGYLDALILSTLLETIQKDWDINSVQAGVLAMANPVGMCLASFVCARLSRRYRELNLILIGMVIWISGVIISGLSSTFGLLLVGRMIVGLGAAPIFGLEPALVNEAAPESSKGLWIGLNNVASSFGAAMGPLFANQVDHSTPRWQNAFLYESPMMVGFLLIGLFPYVYKRFMKTGKIAREIYMSGMIAQFMASLLAHDDLEEQTKHPLNESSTPDFINHSIQEITPQEADEEEKQDENQIVETNKDNEVFQFPTSQKPVFQELAILGRNSTYVFFVLSTCCSFFTVGCFMTFGNEYLQREFNMDQSSASYSISFINFVTAFGTIPIGTYIYDRVVAKDSNPSKAFRCQTACKFIFWGNFFAALIGFPSILGHTQTSFIIGAGLAYSITTTVGALSTLACVNCVPEELINLSISVTLIATNFLATIPASPVFGSIANVSGYHVAMVICFSPLIVGACTSFLTWICSCAPGKTFQEQWKCYWRRKTSKHEPLKETDHMIQQNYLSAS